MNLTGAKALVLVKSSVANASKRNGSRNTWMRDLTRFPEESFHKYLQYFYRPDKYSVP